MKNPFELNRIQLAEELRRFTTKEELDELLEQSTAILRTELVWHLSPEKSDERHPEDCKLCFIPVRLVA